jgi:2'-5' RNA ligase
MHRLFVAIRLPEPIRDLLIDAMDDSPELGWVSYDNLHLTLRFIGEVERPLANDIADQLSRIRFPRFDLKISGLGHFERRNGGALWAGVEPRKPLAELAGKVDRACIQAGQEPERRAFHPHITLARYGRRSADAASSFEQRNGSLSSGAFEVREFVLFESQLSRHGARYEELETYTLC